MHRLLVPAAVVLAAALLAAGCGGSDDEPEANSATVWAGQLCTALSGWVTVVKNTANGLKAGNLDKESLASAGNDVKTATTTLVDEVKDLPTPDTDAGDQAKEEVDQLADNLQKGADDIESAVDDLNDSGSVVSAATTVGTTLATMQSEMRSTVNSVRELDAQGDLRTAFQDAVPCQELTRAT
jgi:methyl-accepting chemotaxis protein